jgi:hypothetical protein
MELEYILYEFGYEEFTKNKCRSQRRYKNRIIRKNNTNRINTEPYEGPDKPDSMCCCIPSKYKRIMRKKRRAKEIQATRNGKEIFFKKEDGYNWY